MEPRPPNTQASAPPPSLLFSLPLFLFSALAGSVLEDRKRDRGLHLSLIVLKSPNSKTS